MIVPFAGIFSIAAVWIQQQYYYWLWLRWFEELVLAAPLLLLGLVMLIVPTILLSWYRRLNNQLSVSFRIMGERVIKYMPSAGYYRNSIGYVYAIGLGLTIFGALGCWSTISDIIARPECFFVMCSVVRK
jgi:hypothetical protein